MSEDVSWSSAAQGAFTCQVSDWIRQIGEPTPGSPESCGGESQGDAFHRLNELTQAIDLGGQAGGSEARIQMRVLILKRLRVPNEQVADLAHEDWTICHRHARALTAEYPTANLCVACQHPVNAKGPGGVIEPLMQDALARISSQTVTGQPVCSSCQMKLSSCLDSVTTSGSSLPVDLFRQCLIDQNLFATQLSLAPCTRRTRMVCGLELADLDVLRNFVWTTVSFSEAFALTSSRVPTLRCISRDRSFRSANACAWTDLTVRECMELFLTWKAAPRRFQRETLVDHWRRAGVIQDWSEHRTCAQLCLGIFEKVENLYAMSVDNEKKTGFWSKMKTFLSLRLAQVIYIPKDAEESDSLMSVVYQEDRDDSRPTTLCLSCPDLECQSCRELIERPYFSGHRFPLSNLPLEEAKPLSVYVSCQFSPNEPNLISQSGRIPSLRLLAAGLNQKIKPSISPKMEQQVTIALVLDFYLTYSANEPKEWSHQCHLFYMDFRFRQLFCSTSKERFLDKVISVRARIEHLTKVSQNGPAQTIANVAEKLRRLLLTPFSCSEPINEPSRQGFLLSKLPSLGLAFPAKSFLKTEYLCCLCAASFCSGTCVIPLVPLNAPLTCDRNQPPSIPTPSQMSKKEPLLNKWSDPKDTPQETGIIKSHKNAISNGANNQRPSFYSRSAELVQMYLNPRDLNGILEYLNCQPLENSVSWQVSRITDDEILFQRKDKEVRAELQTIENSYTKSCFRGNALSAFQDEILPSLLKITSSYLVSDGDLELFKHIPNHGKEAYSVNTNGHYPKMETEDCFISEEDVKIETLDFHSMVEDHLALGDLTDHLILENTGDPGSRLSVLPSPKNHALVEDGFSRGCDTPPPPLEDSTAHHSILERLEEWYENSDAHMQDNGLKQCPKGEQLMLVVPPIMKKPKVESTVSIHPSTASAKMSDKVLNNVTSSSGSDSNKTIGQHAVVCKIGRFACPICGTIYRLNQPYGKHVANRDCTKTKHDKRTPSREEFTLLYVMIHPGREGTDSTIGYGRVPSLRLLCRGIQMSSPCIPPGRLPPLTNKECLEINFSLKRSDKAFEREERWKYLTQRHIFHHIGNCVMFLNLGNNVLKVVDMLEKKIKAAKAKSNLLLVQQWNNKLTTYLGIPFHDNLNIAKVGKFKAYEYPSPEGTSVKVLCLNCPQTDCYGCAEVGSSRASTSKKNSTQSGANKKKKKKLVFKRGNKHQRDYYAAVGVWKTKAKLKEARQSVGQVLGYRRVATYSEVINHELKIRAALHGSCGPSDDSKSLSAASKTTMPSNAKPGPKSKKATTTRRARSKPSLDGSPTFETNGGFAVLASPDGPGHEVPMITSNNCHQEKRHPQRHNQYEQDQERHIHGLEQQINGHFNHQYEHPFDNGTNDYSHVFIEQVPPMSLSSNVSNELHRLNSLNASNQQGSASHNHLMSSWMSSSPFNGHFEPPETAFQNVGMDTIESILPD